MNIFNIGENKMEVKGLIADKDGNLKAVTNSEFKKMLENGEILEDNKVLILGSKEIRDFDLAYDKYNDTIPKPTTDKDMAKAHFFPFQKLSNEEIKDRSEASDSVSQEELDIINCDDEIRDKYSTLFGDAMAVSFETAKKMLMSVNKKTIFISNTDDTRMIPINELVPDKINKGDYLLIKKFELKISPTVQALYDTGKMKKSTYESIRDGEKNGFNITYVTMEEENEHRFISRIFSELKAKINDNRKLYIDTLNEDEEKELYNKLKQKYGDS